MRRCFCNLGLAASARLAVALLLAAAGRAADRRASSPEIGPDTAIGVGLPALAGGTLAQVEPQAVRSFTDPGFVVATFQANRYADGGAAGIASAVSQDGGVTWRGGVVSQLAQGVDGGPFARVSDPVAALDLEGNLYVCSVGLNGVAPNFLATVAVSKSTDRGQTFAAPRLPALYTNQNLFTDKPWLTVNTFAGTPTADRLVATWTLFQSTNADVAAQGPTPIDLAYSDDGGQHWSAPRTITSPHCQGSQPLFLPDGSLAVIYWDFAGPAGDQIEVVASPDGGVTFGPASVVAPVSPYLDPIARSMGFLPSAAADRQAGVLYVVYQALGNPLVAPIPRILFTRSVDHGRSWSAPVAVNDTPGAAAVFNPAVAASADGQHVTVIFYDKRNDAGNGTWVDLYLAESFDAGLTWQPNLRVTDASSDLTLAPETTAGRMVGDYLGLVPALNFETPGVAVWIDTRPGVPAAYAARLQRTQGTTFATWQRLRFTPAQLGDAAISGPAADRQNDGLPNLLKYALGREPSGPAPTAAPFQIGPGANGSVALSFSALAVLGDVSFVWRLSSDLARWSAVSPSTEQRQLDATPLLVRQQVTFPPSAGPRFFSLGAELPVPGP